MYLNSVAKRQGQGNDGKPYEQIRDHSAETIDYRWKSPTAIRQLDKIVSRMTSRINCLLNGSCEQRVESLTDCERYLSDELKESRLGPKDHGFTERAQKRRPELSVRANKFIERKREPLQ